MGRTTQSQGLAPPAIRKYVRAKQARQIVNQIVPAILASNVRARNGVEGSELIVDPPVAREFGVTGSKKEGSGSTEVVYVKRKGQGRRRIKNVEDEGKDRRRDSLDERIAKLSLALDPTQASPTSSNPMRIKIIVTDTLTASHILTFPSKHPSFTLSSSSSSNVYPPTSRKNKPNTCILNMASPLRPGGGTLSGATSQEEFLCSRTTLLPSLHESFYRLPDIGGIFTKDVLVFRNARVLGEASGELEEERYWVDVVSAGMLRFPELEGGKRLGKKDREVVERKMRAVMRIAYSKGVKKMVLGPWGCGAYGNPVADIAQAWRKVLLPDTELKRETIGEEPERWEHIEEVVFAISNAKMAGEFATAFGCKIAVELGPGGDVDDGEAEEEDKVAKELRDKIREMEVQIEEVWNADLKTRMGVILEGLRTQLREREGNNSEDKGNGDEDDEDRGSEILEANSDERGEHGETAQARYQDSEDEADADDGGFQLFRR
ncbi:uncharacterized protein BDR25DRAFT_372739 [Lindgomyces ingoldianus]|uniref:Uncharacterized protein n=1 Tax=Lindgomyces ingoldianus TaxID=673940 RepID=A0ACB6QQM9_9PLEO|nr:uncharacterized protein BDR25DRAFT_372739 [Lindgomyces ingoldianus]KAF2468878.1 hypothetical protein BDR25DRAFT_372739 [Lindgomyces ingoldianus]